MTCMILLLIILTTSGIYGRLLGHQDSSRGPFPDVQPLNNALTCESLSVEAEPGKNVTVTCWTTLDLNASTLQCFHNVSGIREEIGRHHQRQTGLGEHAAEFTGQAFLNVDPLSGKILLTLSPVLTQKGGRILFSIRDRDSYTCAVDIVVSPRGQNITSNGTNPTEQPDHNKVIYIVVGVVGGSAVGVTILLCAIPKSRQLICGKWNLKCGKTEEPPNNGMNNEQEMPLTSANQPEPTRQQTAAPEAGRSVASSPV